jgi:CheY-like chemotaxis protein
MWHHSNKGNKSIKFSDDSIKCCICFIEFQSSSVNNNLISLSCDNDSSSQKIREYYSIVINSISQIIKKRNGKIVKSLGDRLLCYFLNFSDINNEKAFEEVIECGFELLEKKEEINQELSRNSFLPSSIESYKITIDWGVVDLALAGDNYQTDIFGSTVNICSKINSSHYLSIPNQLIIGDKFYKILKSFPNIINKYDFKNNGEYQINETIGYATYSIKKVNKSLSINDSYIINSLSKELLDFSHEDILETKNKEKKSFFHKKNDSRNERIIIVDDDEDILFTFRSFLIDYDYHITSFTDPCIALNYIKEISNFNDLLIILDIRMKKLNGIQLYQQIKAIDPTVKIIFITALDILDELLSIVPGISKDQILQKPIDKNFFAHTVKQQLK